MDTDEFDLHVELVAAAKPSWFSEAENPATIEQIVQAERTLGARLPFEYKHFAQKFGAGYFGRINIASVEAASVWYRADKPVPLADGRSLFVVSDDQTGGYYGFVISDGKCEDAVRYIHPDDGDTLEEVASSFFEYVVTNGLP